MTGEALTGNHESILENDTQKRRETSNAQLLGNDLTQKRLCSLRSVIDLEALRKIYLRAAIKDHHCKPNLANYSKSSSRLTQSSTSDGKILIKS